MKAVLLPTSRLVELQSCGCAQKESAARVGKANLGKVRVPSDLSEAEKAERAALIARRDARIAAARPVRRIRHGLSGHPLYKTWLNIVQRTTNPKDKDYKWYGGVGITLDPVWKCNVEAFVSYIDTELGPKPTPEHSLGRLDTDTDLYPGNLGWATQKEQLANRRPYDRAAAGKKSWAKRKN